MIVELLARGASAPRATLFPDLRSVPFRGTVLCMTPEEKKAKDHEYYIANKARIEAKRQERLAAMSPEERDELRRKQAEARDRHYAAHPEAKLEKSRKAQQRTKERYNNDPEFKARWRAYQKTYQDKHRDEIREKNREASRLPRTRHLKRLSRGMIFAEGQTEETMRAAQNNLCAICKDELPEGKHCHVDHDHTTGKVRGLLCHHCNTALGLFDENPDLMEKAAVYLETHSQEGE